MGGEKGGLSRAGVEVVKKDSERVCLEEHAQLSG